VAHLPQFGVVFLAKRSVPALQLLDVNADDVILPLMRRTHGLRT
jgi:hypothetical protein